MTYIYKNPAGMTDSEKTEHIKKVVTAEGVALRKRHPILNHQNAIGAMILFISLVGMIATAVLYINHQLSAWFAIDDKSLSSSERIMGPSENLH